MTDSVAPSHRPHPAPAAPELVDGDLNASPLPRPGSRLLRGAIAASAVTAVGVIALVTPGLAQASGTGTAAPQPARATVAAGTVESFAARGTSTDRDAVRESLTETGVADAAEARTAFLTAQGQQVATTQQQVALASRASGLDETATQIRVEGERLRSLTFFKPTDGGITSPWGMRLHPILRYVRMHGGVDMGGACGQPIWAARDGVVTDVSSGSQSGRQVRLDHGAETGERIETAYLHMQSIGVKVGQEVKRGEKIGTVGSTGLSTACHLHFAVYSNGDNVDPQRYLG